MAKGNHGCLIASSIVIILLAAFGFWIYKVFYWDYSKSVDAALESGNYKKAEQIVGKMADVAEKRHNENCTWEDYKTAYYKVLSTEIDYLLNDGSEIGVDRLVALLQSKKMGAVPVTGKTASKDVQEANERYNTSVARHHAIMDNIISRAIATKNEYLAKSIVTCYRPILEKSVVETHLLKADECEYTYSYEPQQKAEAIVQKAIKDGKFK